MPRFVVLTHDHPHLHWDFMLEQEGVLRTWRLPQPPAAGRVLEAEQLAPHRIAYLDYEGPVSGNRGTVQRWDRGEFSIDEFTDSAVRIQLRGAKLDGRVELARIKADQWKLEYRL